MSEDTLRAYLRQVLKEEYFKRDYENDMKISFPIMKKVRNFFFGENADDIVDEWLDSKESYYDISFEEDFRDEVKNFSNKVYKKALNRAKDNKEKAVKMLKKTLDIKYTKKLRDLEKDYLKVYDDEI